MYAKTLSLSSSFFKLNVQIHTRLSIKHGCALNQNLFLRQYTSNIIYSLDIVMWRLHSCEINGQAVIRTSPEEFESGDFTSKTASNFFRPQYAEERKPDCVLAKLCKGNPLNVVMPSFLKRSVLKMFSVHNKTKRWRFQIRPV